MILSSELRVVSCELTKICAGAARRRGAVSKSAKTASGTMPANAARRGFTLVELLVTIAIIAILAAAMLGASNAAMESARVSKTKSTIAKIDGLLTQRYQTYTTRRVNLSLNALNRVNAIPSGTPAQQKLKGLRMADYRLLALRELMKLEMPDRWSDVNGAAITASPVPPTYVAYPALASAYMRRLKAALTGQNKLTNTSNTAAEITQHQGAECLYQVIMLATGDGEARTLFTDQEINDVDGDGLFEFVDGWGNPISYLRWPAGYVAANTANVVTPSSFLMSGDASSDHDPFDPFRRDLPNSGSSIAFLSDAYGAFRLVPLVYSAGADEASGIVSKDDDYVVVQPDPYTTPVGSLPGTINSEEAIDNITNQDIQK